MVTYATFIICLASAFIAGGVVAIAWRILTEKDGGAPSIRERTTVKPGRPATNIVTGKCPVENCRIRVPHSHTDALIRDIKRR